MQHHPRGDGHRLHGARLPGCVVAGRSRYEAEEAMRIAIAFHLESLRQSGMPRPSSATPSKLAAGCAVRA
ncbi:MAG: type II toxin-antitoxin system HicB family antitoxin [Pedosphaera sp.]|nr:type II toxin-antitoxin system HicB family antitoxin [Pedosphaera sp.]MST00204.1 type II toxin-antitoxin system HicB family antitoxin [Pedosphaera sp.]